MECSYLKLELKNLKLLGAAPPSTPETNWCKKKSEIQDPFEMMHVKGVIQRKAFELKLFSSSTDFFCPFFESKKFSLCPYFEAGQAERIPSQNAD